MSENPMGLASTWSLVAEGYEQETMPLFRVYGENLLAKVQYPPRCERALDVACGPGTLSLLIKDRTDKVDAVDYAENMLKVFNRRIKNENIANITTQQMDGQELKFTDSIFNFAFSMFGLMFFADRVKGFQELYRVLKPGGRVGVTSWAPIEKSPMMQLAFNTFRAAFGPPAASESPEDKTGIETLEDPAVFKKEMQQVGFRNVQISECRGSWPISEDGDRFIESLEKGAAPIALMKSKTDPKLWQEKRKIMVDYLTKQKLPNELYSTAYIGVGEK